jgi:hypothetical protein
MKCFEEKGGNKTTFHSHTNLTMGIRGMLGSSQFEILE